MKKFDAKEEKLDSSLEEYPEPKPQKEKEKEKTALAKRSYTCLTCSNTFSGPKTNQVCPNCGEESPTHLMAMTTSGLPLIFTQYALGRKEGTFPPILDGETQADSSTNLDPITPEIEAVLTKAFKREMITSTRNAVLEGVRANLAEATAKRVSAEKSLGKGKGDGNTDSGANIGTNVGAGLSFFLSGIGKLPTPEREAWLNRLASDPQFAINLGLLLNPGSINANMGGFAPWMAGMMGGGGGGGGSNGSTIVEVAEALKTLNDIKPNNAEITVLASKIDALKSGSGQTMTPQDIINIVKEIKNMAGDSNIDAETRKEIQELNNKVLSLQAELLKNQSGGDIKQEINDLKQEIRNIGSRNPTQSLTEAAELFRQFKEIQETINPNPKPDETFDEWHKKYLLTKDREMEKLAREKEIKTIEAKGAKWNAQGQIITNLMKGALSDVTKVKKPELILPSAELLSMIGGNLKETKKEKEKEREGEKEKEKESV